jgi:hypothetical protein
MQKIIILLQVGYSLCIISDRLYILTSRHSIGAKHTHTTLLSLRNGHYLLKSLKFH